MSFKYSKIVRKKLIYMPKDIALPKGAFLYIFLFLFFQKKVFFSKIIKIRHKYSNLVNINIKNININKYWKLSALMHLIADIEKNINVRNVKIEDM